jgi:RNA polymerase sporulation-specific sigma factor
MTEERKGLTEEQKRLAEDNIRLVYYIYEKLRKTETVVSNKDDIIGEGMIGLVKAARSYDSEKCRFSTFAARCITNEMLMFLRREKKHLQASSLFAEAGCDEDGKELLLIDTIADGRKSGESMEAALIDKETIADILADADERTRKIVVLLAAGKNRREIGEAVGISQSYVSRLLGNLKKKYEKNKESEENKENKESAA